MALVISGHPDYEHSIANKTIITALEQAVPGIEVRHLAALYPDFRIAAEAEQAALLRHRVVVVQYPFYWYNMPAILKHWFDVVFTYGFAYGSGGNQLQGKYLLPGFTVGGPADSYHPLGKNHFRVPDFCHMLEQTAYFAGMHYLEPVYGFGTSRAAGFTETEIVRNATLQAGRLMERVLELENAGTVAAAG
jgi:putative NADPH-quinone reductase